MLQDIAPHIYDITFRQITPQPTDKMLLFHQNCILCREENGIIHFPSVSDIAAACNHSATYLFCIDDIRYFTLNSVYIEAFDGWHYLPKDTLRRLPVSWQIFAAITGFQLSDWYQGTKYCGCCGALLSPSETERAMACSCGRIFYPQICPCVIVGITNGDKLLLTKYSATHGNTKRYALVAGYAEIGESFEDTIRREVAEEVGLSVKNIRYYASQPWSYSGSLLAGFFCEVDGSDTITIDETELSCAEWLSREDIPEESANPSFSLTGTMIHAFKYKNEK